MCHNVYSRRHLVVQTVGHGSPAIFSGMGDVVVSYTESTGEAASEAASPTKSAAEAVAAIDSLLAGIGACGVLDAVHAVVKQPSSDGRRAVLEEELVTSGLLADARIREAVLDFVSAMGRLEEATSVVAEMRAEADDMPRQIQPAYRALVDLYESEVLSGANNSQLAQATVQAIADLVEAAQ